jgi:hypothetical protein
MKKKNGLLQTFFYDFLKIQVTNWVQEILVTCKNQLSIIYWFLLRYSDYLGTEKIASSRFQSPVKKKNRKLRHWRPTARSLTWCNKKESIVHYQKHMHCPFRDNMPFSWYSIRLYWTAWIEIWSGYMLKGGGTFKMVHSEAF